MCEAGAVCAYATGPSEVRADAGDVVMIDGGRRRGTIVALWLLVRWLEKGKLHYFAYWCIPLGILIVIMQLT